MNRVLGAICLLALLSCGAPAAQDGGLQVVDAGELTDAGGKIDAGAGPDDAGHDGGAADDGGAPDSGLDGGTDGGARDAGPVTLTGTGVPGSFDPTCTPTSTVDFLTDNLRHYQRIQPRDCSLVRLNPPDFSWSVPAGVSNVTWTLTVRNSAGGIAFTTTTTSPVPGATPPASLPPGTYTWSVSYPSASGTRTSSPRQFTVSPRAISLVFPGPVALSQVVTARPHPRVLAPGTTFADLARLARTGEYAMAYATTLAQANATLPGAVPRRAIPVAPELRPNPPALGTMLSEALNERRFIETLAYAAQLETSSAFRQESIDRLMALAAWSPTGISSQSVPGSDDQLNREIYLTLAQGFDLLYPFLTATQRTAVIAAIAPRLTQARAELFRESPEAIAHKPYQSHALTSGHYILQALLLVAGSVEYPGSAALLEKQWGLMRYFHNVWGYQDGGFGNGSGYGWHELMPTAQTAALLELTGGIEFIRHPYNLGLGRFLMHFTAPSSARFQAFGDDHWLTTFYEYLAPNDFRLYAQLTGNSAESWYWRFADAAWISPLHYALLGRRTLPVAPVAPAEDSAVFPDVGFAVIHSRGADPRRSSVYFRSSEFGAWSHSHADHNSFVFDSRGENLLISSGYNDGWRSPHHVTVNRVTRYQNALTFNGGFGQAESSGNLTFNLPSTPSEVHQNRDFVGSLINFHDHGEWAVVSGDATAAYGVENAAQHRSATLTRALRSVAYHRGERVLVVYDSAASMTPRTWELNFHSRDAFSMHTFGLRASRGAASACIQVNGLGSQPALALERLFAVPTSDPVRFPEQFHARFSAAQASSEVTAITIVREDCRDVPVSVVFAGTRATVAVNGGAPIVFAERSVSLPGQ